MSAAIVYYSNHHGNTKQVIDAIAEKFPVTLIDVTKEPNPDLSGYDLVGFASGIYYNKFAKQIIALIQSTDLKGKRCFTVFTSGSGKEGCGKDAQEAILKSGGTYLGKYACLGYDTFGPLKLIGGIAKDHPNQKEKDDAFKFFAGCQVFRF